jgi:hypothetical protein
MDDEQEISRSNLRAAQQKRRFFFFRKKKKKKIGRQPIQTASPH